MKTKNLIKKTWILLGLFLAIGVSVPTQVKAETLPKRETFTLPVQMKGLAKGLEKAGVKIIYGPQYDNQSL